MPLDPDTKKYILPPLTKDLLVDLRVTFPVTSPTALSLSSPLGTHDLAYEAGKQHIIDWLADKLSKATDQ